MSNELKDIQASFWESLGRGTDTALAIQSACLLDQLLTKLIEFCYIKDPKVKTLFKDDHLLQSFNSKINIAYFSGFIPHAFYHDLRLICAIRNKFAHAVDFNMSFEEKTIRQKIDRFIHGPKLEDIPDDVPTKYRLRFLLVVQQIYSTTHVSLDVSSIDELNIRPPHLVEILGLNKVDYSNKALSTDKMRQIISQQKRGKTI